MRGRQSVKFEGVSSWTLLDVYKHEFTKLENFSMS